MPKPAPFRRPSVSLSSGEKKEWREVSIFSLERGDIVRDKGAFDTIYEAGNDLFQVFWKNGTFDIFEEGDRVLAFVRV